MNNPKPRKALPNDSEFAFQTKKAAFKPYIEQVWGWDEQEQRQLHTDRFTTQNFQVIMQSDIKLGIMATVKEHDCLKLYQLFILPEFQGQGVGTACMMDLFENALALKLPIRSRVLKVNHRAIAFYHRLGFEVVGESETHVMIEKGFE